MTTHPSLAPYMFRRCPSCGGVDWPPRWHVTHRPRCPHADTHPDTWETP